MFRDLTYNMRREFHEGLADTPINGIFELFRGAEADGKVKVDHGGPYQDRPNLFRQQMRLTAVNAMKAQWAIKKGYDPVKMMVNAQILHSMGPGGHMGGPGPMQRQAVADDEFSM